MLQIWSSCVPVWIIPQFQSKPIRPAMDVFGDIFAKTNDTTQVKHVAPEKMISSVIRRRRMSYVYNHDQSSPVNWGIGQNSHPLGIHQQKWRLNQHIWEYHGISAPHSTANASSLESGIGISSFWKWNMLAMYLEKKYQYQYNHLIQWQLATDTILHGSYHMPASIGSMVINGHIWFLS